MIQIFAIQSGFAILSIPGIQNAEVQAFFLADAGHFITREVIFIGIFVGVTVNAPTILNYAPTKLVRALKKKTFQ